MSVRSILLAHCNSSCTPKNHLLNCKLSFSWYPLIVSIWETLRLGFVSAPNLSVCALFRRKVYFLEKVSVRTSEQYKKNILSGKTLIQKMLLVLLFKELLFLTMAKIFFKL